MHDLAYLIGTVFGSVTGLIVALTTAYKAFTNYKEKVKEEQDKKHKEEQQDMELYRHRWLEAEKGNDELRKQIDDLRKKEKDHED